MPTILVICTGNLCRSPMAEALLRTRLDRDEARRDWQVSSAGTWAAEGRPASAYAIEEMAEREIDLGAHRSRSVTHELMEEADLVLVMTRNHAEALAVAFPDQAHKVYLLSEMVWQRGDKGDKRRPLDKGDKGNKRRSLHPLRPLHAYDISDPYGGTRMEYAYIAEELEQLIESGYERIVTLVEGGTDG